MKKHTFKLSPAGKLAAAVTIISVSVAPVMPPVLSEQAILHINRMLAR